MASFILTLDLDEPSFAYAQALRQAHFPASLNLVPAHITLFHTLPNDASIKDDLARLSLRQKVFYCTTSRVRFLGKGSALEIESTSLLKIRQNLAVMWEPFLTRQDRQTYRPHLTVQNKAELKAAKAFFEELEASFKPVTLHATGLLLWNYLGGPWELEERFSFQT